MVSGADLADLSEWSVIVYESGLAWARRHCRLIN